MQPRGLASPPASGAATPIPGTSRLLTAAYDDDDFNTTSSEDDELIEHAGRCASSPDGSFIGCEDDDDDVASPASLYRGAAAGSEAAKLGAILADHRCAVFSQAAQRTWAHEAAFHAGMQQAAKLRVAVPTRLVGYDAAVQQPMKTPLAAADADAAGRSRCVLGHRVFSAPGSGCAGAALWCCALSAPAAQDGAVRGVAGAWKLSARRGVRLRARLRGAADDQGLDVSAALFLLRHAARMPPWRRLPLHARVEWPPERR
jgi:hypothetical protein